MTIKAYGKTDIEILADEIDEAHRMTETILNFGVTQRQMLHLIYNFSLELENREHMLALSDLAKEILDVNAIAASVPEEIK